ncbi:MAG: hypothetical protein IJX72_07030 [Clostridia bacterium]|nr:hypothetical protein [Clostridia bacterium]
MKTTVVRRLLSVALCLTLLTGVLGMTACSSKSPVLLELDGIEITANQYQFFLSRVKGSLYYTGYNVESADFWNMIIDDQNNTYDDYFRNAVLDDARRYVAALTIFEERDLVLPQSYLDQIDEEMEEYLRDAGSKSTLNTLLASYGVNLDMLREIYIMEAKYDYLQQVIYGTDGELLAAETRMAYLNEHAVCFKQVLIRAFDYVYEKDTNGDEVYYLPSENNAKVNNIAYDKIAGDVRVDEYGKTITDNNGDEIYFLPDGKIAYDKENGVRAMVYDQDGNLQTVKYSTETLAEHKAAAEEILATVAKGDYAAFEALLAEYEDNDDDAFVTDGTYCFLYTTGDNSYDYLNDIADELAASENGELAMINSEYGYNVVMKYPIPDDAITNTDYEDWFSDLTDRIIAKQFHTMCKPYMEKVTVDAEVFATLPSMKEIATNTSY